MPEFNPATVLAAVQAEFGGDAPPQAVTVQTFNRVFIQRETDRPYVVKCPRFAAPEDARAAVERERIALEAVNSASSPCPFEVPAVRGTGEVDGQPYIVVSFIPGEQLSAPVRDIGKACARHIGRSLTELGLWMDEAIPADTMDAAPTTPQSVDWDEFLNFDFADRQFPSLSRLAAEMQLRRETYYPDGIAAAADRFNHGDLRTDNLLFSEGTIAAIIDFGNAQRGDFAQEMRALHELGEPAIEGCNEVLAPLGRELTMEQLEMWQIGRAVNGLIRIRRGIIEPKPERLNVIGSYLAQHCPGLDWSELAQLAQHE